LCAIFNQLDNLGRPKKQKSAKEILAVINDFRKYLGGQAMAQTPARNESNNNVFVR